MSEFLFQPSPHQEAVAFLKAKPAVSRAVFDQLLPELRARAFTIAGIEGANVLQAVRDRIADLPAGGNWDDIKQDIVDDISPWLIDVDSGTSEERAKQQAGVGRKAELLLRLHGNQAYAAAAYDVMDRQRDVFPNWMYMTMEDERVRPEHAALDGLVLPANHEFWQTHFPPWDYGCRCQIVPISDADYEDIEKSDAKRAPEEKQILSPALQEELTRNRRIQRGNLTLDVRSPREKKGDGAFSWNPGDLHIPLDALKGHYDAPIWGAFEAFARRTQLPESKLTVWEWLEGRTIIEQTAKTVIEPLVAAFEQIAPGLAAIAAKFDRRAKKFSDAIQAIILPPPDHPTRPKVERKLTKLQLALAQVARKRQGEALAILALPKELQPEIAFTYAPRSQKSAAHGEGFKFVQALLHKKLWNNQPVEVLTRAARAHADTAGKFINGKRMTAQTVIHETGHIIEQRSPEILAKSLAFLDSRTPGEHPQWLGPPFPRKEVAKFDQWKELKGHRYTGKIYEAFGKRFASEILSTGLERLAEDATVFFQSDPQFFAFVINTLRGL